MPARPAETDLARHIQETLLVDTHEHLRYEQEWVERGPDILQDLFGHYPQSDLLVAGASPEAVRRLLDASDPDVAGRFAAIRPAWEAMQHTGYGEAIRDLAERLYGLPELTPEGLVAAQERLQALRRPGERYRLLREVGRLDHVQIDHFRRACPPDPSGPEFFLYDLSWTDFARGRIDPGALAAETGVTVSDLGSLELAMAALFDRWGHLAIAVKSQHAYQRTLCWQERSRSEAAAALSRILRQPDGADEEDRLCLGDWCWAKGLELAAAYGLPFKIHTGYLAGHGRMPISRLRAGHLCELLARYPQARFVLMHIAYPYSDELVALAKHFPNVWVDLCWAWSIDPYTTCDFLRRFLHAVPANKLFAFGGDTFWPTHAVAYAWQARRWLTRALEAEVAAGDLTEAQAIRVATRLMRENQFACFDVEGRRATLRARLGPGGELGGSPSAGTHLA